MPIDNATLKQLRMLMVSASEGSFSAAGKRLHVSQSAISQQIRQLEDRCGHRLLDRGRQLSLTEAGDEVLRLAQRIELELRRAERRLRRQKPGASIHKKKSR